MLAVYEKTIYQNAENGFCIYGMTSEDEDIPQEARNGYYSDDKIHFSVTGFYLPAIKNIMLDLIGKWEKSKYGLQFKVESFTEVIPKTAAGIAAYLSSGLIKGIGTATAELIVAKFGTDALLVMEQDPNRLLEIKGITERKLETIMESFSENKGLQELLTFLAPYGVTPHKAKKIQEHFGSRAIAVIQHQPFLLCEINGFGFKTVDEIARKVNFEPQDPLRIEGGLKYTLEDAREKGDLYLLEGVLLEKATLLLNERVSTADKVTDAMVETVYRQMCAEKKLVNEERLVYLPMLYQYETTTAQAVAKMLKARKKKHLNLQRHLEDGQKENGILLSEKQEDAVAMCMNHNLSIITGGPGTGKTTVLKVILSVYAKLYPGKEILLTAPTGRAARKMAESTGYPHAMTLHAALGMTTEDYRSEDRPILEADFVILDEASMLDMHMASCLFESLGSRTKVLFVGDVEQLPSVGAGNVLKEMISCGEIPVTVLDMVFRQKDTSRIALNAHSIKAGDTKLLYGDDFQFIPADTPEEAAVIIKEEFHRAVDSYGLENVQVLTPFRVKSEAGAQNLNRLLRELVNPCMDKSREVTHGSRTFRFGDKVMQIKNMEDVSNGDIGFVSRTEPKAEQPVTVCFSDGRYRRYGQDELNCMELAYAVTIHKSQGGEYDCVIIPVLNAFYIMLQRALIYTAITRAKKKVILVGEKRAIFTAIHKNDSIRRNTCLGKRIQEDIYKEEKPVKKKKESIEQLTL